LFLFVGSSLLVCGELFATNGVKLFIGHTIRLGIS
jgi:hypothetical protein